MYNIILSLFLLFVGWTCFVIAVVNIAVAAHNYIVGKEGSRGRKATLKMLLFSLSFTFWYYIVFYIFPWFHTMSILKMSF